MSASAAITRSPPSPSISASARLPRSRLLSPASWICCVIFLHPVCRVAIAGDLGVQDEKVCLQVAHVGAHLVAMTFQQRATFALRLRAARPERRVAQHV